MLLGSRKWSRTCDLTCAKHGCQRHPGCPLSLSSAELAYMLPTDGEKSFLSISTAHARPVTCVSPWAGPARAGTLASLDIVFAYHHHESNNRAHRLYTHGDLETSQSDTETADAADTAYAANACSAFLTNPTRLAMPPTPRRQKCMSKIRRNGSGGGELSSSN